MGHHFYGWCPVCAHLVSSLYCERYEPSEPPYVKCYECGSKWTEEEYDKIRSPFIIWDDEKKDWTEEAKRSLDEWLKLRYADKEN